MIHSPEDFNILSQAHIYYHNMHMQDLNKITIEFFLYNFPTF
jgi:hypothetical protein